MGKIRQADLLRTDEFLACEKTLVDDEPGWFKLQNGRWAAIWPVRDDLGAVRGQLNFRVDPKYSDFPSLSLLFENHPVCRLDTAPQTMVKVNPPWAFGCPPTVAGNHLHSWEDNRDFMLSVDNWILQARQPVEPAVKRVPHMLRWFAEHTNLRLCGSQFGFDFDPKRDLYGEETAQ